MKLTMILVFFLFVLQSQTSVNAEICESKSSEIQSCYKDFVGLYNYSEIPHYKFFVNYTNFIALELGWKGEELLCKRGLSLIQCINGNGVTLSSKCLSKIFNFSSDDNIGYINDYYQVNFRCQGEGLKEFKETYNCSQQPFMNNCPDDIESCLAIEAYLNCITPLAEEKCGKTFADYIKTSIDITVNITFNSCLPTSSLTPSPPKNLTILYILFAVVIFVAIILITFLVIKNRYLAKRKIACIELQHQERPNSPEVALPQSPFNDCYIEETKIRIDFEKILGKGYAGTVYAATIEQQPKSPPKIMAIKIPTQSHQNYMEEFSHEIEISKKLNCHSSICAVTFWTLYRELPCLIFEKMDTDLLSFVKEYNQPERRMEFPPTKLFLQFLWQISDALIYIASKNLVHRDVATRNILIGHPNIAKLSDFGLCSEFDESTATYLSSIYKKLPVKWLPPEALSNRIFSEKSDVWAFGITMYEMWTMGEQPYAEMAYTELVEFLKSGLRLKVPEKMEEQIGEIMTSCWVQNVQKRPTFEKLKNEIEKLLEKELTNYGYLLYT